MGMGTAIKNQKEKHMENRIEHGVVGYTEVRSKSKVPKSLSPQCQDTSFHKSGDLNQDPQVQVL